MEKNTSWLAPLHLSQPASEHIHCWADALLLSKKRRVCKGHVCLYDTTASCALGQKHWHKRDSVAKGIFLKCEDVLRDYHMIYLLESAIFQQETTRSRRGTHPLRQQSCTHTHPVLWVFEFRQKPQGVSLQHLLWTQWMDRSDVSSLDLKVVVQPTVWIWLDVAPIGQVKEVLPFMSFYWGTQLQWITPQVISSALWQSELWTQSSVLSVLREWSDSLLCSDTPCNEKQRAVIQC